MNLKLKRKENYTIMIRIPKTLASFGAVALAAGALTVAAPRAARAIAVALVQVNNTPDAPAVTQDVGKAASQLVSLAPTGSDETALNSIQPLTISYLTPVTTSGDSAPYQVPGGKNLVITEVDVTTFADGTTADLLGVTNFVQTVYESYVLPNTGYQQFRYASGLVFPSGSNVGMFNNSPAANVRVTVHGYLTSN